jgi:aminoglycoside 3-N-acetyltransferase
VGHAHARLCDSRSLVMLAVEHLTANPLTFLCPPAANCEECDAARASVPPSDA